MLLPDFEYRTALPEAGLSDFIESFWSLRHHADEGREVIVLPDGRIDLLFSTSLSEPYHVVLLGLATQPEQNTILPGTQMFAVSFKLLAAEYIFQQDMAALLDHGCRPPANQRG